MASADHQTKVDNRPSSPVQETRTQTLSVLQASSMLVGIVVGIGIFQTPPIIAGNVPNEAAYIGVWIAGGLLTLIGALCYAELSSTYPSSGGEYHYLTRAYGKPLSFLFAWGRMTVMQTGAIAAVAFVYGDYASTLLPLGSYGAAIHGVMAILVLTFLQLAGTELSGRAQFWLTVLTVVVVGLVALCGFIAGPQPSTAEPISGSGAIGLAMVFILLTYGGWNEAAYVSGEVKDPQRNMVRVLLLGTGAVMAIYLVVNIALLYMLGMSGLRQASAVMTQPIAQVFGSAGAVIFALIVCIAALSTLNATIFTGSRSAQALGNDFKTFGWLGKSSSANGTPANALIFQLAIALALMIGGSQARSGFKTMVEYTAPAFWTFMLLIGVSVFLFRMREPDRPVAFRVPLYPLPPLIFCLTSLYLLDSSIRYTGTGALVGIAILAAGIPLYLYGRARG